MRKNYDRLTDRKISSLQLARAITISMFKQKQKLERVTNPDTRQARELERLKKIENILLKGRK